MDIQFPTEYRPIQLATLRTKTINYTFVRNEYVMGSLRADQIPNAIKIK